MKERPILFSGAMVRALLDGSKTQTRRIVKPAPSAGADAVDTYHHPDPRPHFYAADREGIMAGWCHPCPYGQPGDRLWVREAWARTKVVQAVGDEWIVYREGDSRTDYGGPWKPSIHMPRAACRIVLEVTAVRVERLQDISEADSVAEGIPPWPPNERRTPKWQCPQHVRRFGDDDNVEDVAYEGFLTKDPREAYRGIWSAINGPGSWEANPWVWAIEFRRIS